MITSTINKIPETLEDFIERFFKRSKNGKNEKNIKFATKFYREEIMKIISLINQKGVGKTTSAINIASKLSEKFKVLAVDIDQQANTTGIVELMKINLNLLCIIFLQKKKLQQSSV